MALIAGRRTRERTLTGKSKHGEGKHAGRERDETRPGQLKQGNTRGENGGRERKRKRKGTDLINGPTWGGASERDSEGGVSGGKPRAGRNRDTGRGTGA